jgi:RNA polymerase sigma factor (sigma-70 family)
MLQDRLLIRRFNRGDTDALRCIYEKYKNDLLKVAAALLNDKEYIEDVIHDVFVSFAGTAGNFRLSGTLKGYLSICVANRARDRNRSIKRQKTLSPNKAGHINSDKNRPDTFVIHNKLSKKIDFAMTLVPDEQREIIILHLLSKMRFRQIARSKGVSVNTVISRYRYGLDKLRSFLDGEFEK